MFNTDRWIVTHAASGQMCLCTEKWIPADRLEERGHPGVGFSNMLVEAAREDGESIAVWAKGPDFSPVSILDAMRSIVDSPEAWWVPETKSAEEQKPDQ